MLTELTDEQATYIGVNKAGPYYWVRVSKTKRNCLFTSDGREFRSDPV